MITCEYCDTRQNDASVEKRRCFRCGAPLDDAISKREWAMVKDWATRMIVMIDSISQLSQEAK